MLAQRKRGGGAFFQPGGQNYYGEMRRDDSLIADLFSKAQNCELDSVIRFVAEKKLALNVRNSDKQTLLHVCIDTNAILDVDVRTRLQFARYLLTGGVSASSPDVHGITPMHLAVQAQDRNLVRLFLSEGVDVNMIDSMKQTPLHYAVTGLLYPCNIRRRDDFIIDSGKALPNTAAVDLLDLAYKTLQTDNAPIISVLNKLIEHNIAKYIAETEIQDDIKYRVNNIYKRWIDTKTSDVKMAQLMQTNIESFVVDLSNKLKKYTASLTSESTESPMAYELLKEKLTTLRTAYNRDAWNLMQKLITIQRAEEKLERATVAEDNERDSIIAKLAIPDDHYHPTTKSTSIILHEFYKLGIADSEKTRFLNFVTKFDKALRDFVDTILRARSIVGTTAKALRAICFAPSREQLVVSAAETAAVAMAGVSIKAVEAAKDAAKTALRQGADDATITAAAAAAAKYAQNMETKLAANLAGAVAAAVASGGVAPEADPVSIAILVAAAGVVASTLVLNGFPDSAGNSGQFATFIKTVTTSINDLHINFTANLQIKLNGLLAAVKAQNAAGAAKVAKIIAAAPAMVAVIEPEILKIAASSAARIAITRHRTHAPSSADIATAVGTTIRDTTLFALAVEASESAIVASAQAVRDTFLTELQNDPNVTVNDAANRAINAGKITVKQRNNVTFDIGGKKLKLAAFDPEWEESEIEREEKEEREKKLGVKSKDGEDEDVAVAIPTLLPTVDTAARHLDRLIYGWDPTDPAPPIGTGVDPLTIGSSIEVYREFYSVLAQLFNRRLGAPAPLNIATSDDAAVRKFIADLDMLQPIVNTGQIDRRHLNRLLDLLQQCRKLAMAEIARIQPKLKHHLDNIYKAYTYAGLATKVVDTTNKKLDTYEGMMMKSFENFDQKIIEGLNAVRERLVERDPLHWMYGLLRGSADINLLTEPVAPPDVQPFTDRPTMDNDITDGRKPWIVVSGVLPNEQIVLISHRVPKFKKYKSITAVADTGDRSSSIELQDPIVEPVAGLTSHEAPGGWPLRDPAHAFTGDVSIGSKIVEDGKLPVPSDTGLNLTASHGEILQLIISELAAQKIVENSIGVVEKVIRSSSYKSDKFPLIRDIVRYATRKAFAEHANQFITFHISTIAVQYIERVKGVDAAAVVAIKKALVDMLGSGSSDRVFQIERPVKSRLDRMATNLLSRIETGRVNVKMLTDPERLAFGNALYHAGSNAGPHAPDQYSGGRQMVNYETWSAGTLNKPICIYYDPEITRLLLRADASISVRNIDGNTPLHLAVMSGNIRGQRILVKSGAMTIGVRSVNVKGHTPLETLRRQILDRVSLCRVSQETQIDGRIVKRNPTRYEMLQEFVRPLSHEISRSFSSNESYRQNYAADIDLCMIMGIMIWNHRLLAHGQIPRSSENISFSKSKEHIETAIAKLQSAGFINSGEHVIVHGLADAKISDLSGKSQSNIAIDSELAEINQQRVNVERELGDVQSHESTLKHLEKNGSAEERQMATWQLANLNTEIAKLKSKLSSIKKLEGKLKTAQKKVDDPLLVLIGDSLAETLKTMPSMDVIKQHREILGAFERKLKKDKTDDEPTMPAYATYCALWREYMNSQKMLRSENLGLAIVEYINSVAQTTNDWRDEHDNIEAVSYLLVNSIRPLPTGNHIYYSQQPEGRALVDVIHMVVKATVGAAMYRSLLHLITDHIAQNSSLGSTTAPGTAHVAGDIPVTGVDTTSTVIQIAALPIGGKDTLVKYLLDTVLIAFIKQKLGILENRYDSDADFNMDLVANAIQARLETNPYFPISTGSNIIEQLNSTFFPFWNDVLYICVSNTRTAIEGWQQYLSMLARQMKMITSLVKLSHPLEMLSLALV
jgi:ankyrin repeat protein